MEGRISIVESRLAVCESRESVLESRFESERGTMIRMETRLYNEIKSVNNSIEDNRKNTDIKYESQAKRTDAQYQLLADKVDKLFRVLWMIVGGIVAVKGVSELVSLIKHAP